MSVDADHGHAASGQLKTGGAAHRAQSDDDHIGFTQRAPNEHNGANITSTTLSIKIDQNASTDLHQQVAAEIRRAIADREAEPGERLPPARDLAAVIGVNTNTVLRALRTLRDEGLLEFRRGRGITVAGSPERGAVIARAQELIDFARHHGYPPKELAQLIEALG
jgi:GntR family transcriptional regulator